MNEDTMTNTEITPEIPEIPDFSSLMNDNEVVQEEINDKMRECMFEIQETLTRFNCKLGSRSNITFDDQGFMQFHSVVVVETNNT